MEDGTEIYNLLDRNLGRAALSRTKKLPKQVLPFDPNDGAASGGPTVATRSCATSPARTIEYGYPLRHSELEVFQQHAPRSRSPTARRSPSTSGRFRIWRFEDNESHTEGLYGMVVACQRQQPARHRRSAIRKMLDMINGIDWTGPDVRHPHVIRGLKIWEAHYAFRPHSPSMLIEGLRIHRVAYGIYRPTFDNQVFRNLHLSNAGGEPFNRGMDDASAQYGRIHGRWSEA